MRIAVFDSEALIRQTPLAFASFNEELMEIPRS